jgi:bifunctional enzyme CysN/CysC/sulfate adenylyltransferase subunit 1
MSTLTRAIGRVLFWSYERGTWQYDLAVILIDATKGILPQTRRHAFISSLLGIKNVLAAVNKMDLVAHSQETFSALQDAFVLLAAQLGIPSVQCIPISALEGDNVVDPSPHMPWYSGPTLLEHLEKVPLPASDSLQGLRFPVQTVLRPDAAFRGFGGRIASGVVRPGDTVLALPSGRQTRVASIVTYDGNLPEAFAPMSVTLQLEDEIDLSRGDMLVSPQQPPRLSRNFQAMVVWLHSTPLQLGTSYLLKHTSRQTKVRPLKIHHRVNVNTLAHESATQLQMNDIALLEFEANVPLFLDPYSSNRTTGSFILIDPLSNATVGAAMVQAEARPSSGETRETQFLSVNSDHTHVAPHERYARHGHAPGVILLENRPALAARLDRVLFENSFESLHLSAADVAPSTLRDALRITRAAGIIAIYSGETLSAETRRAVASEFSDQTTDHAPASAADRRGRFSTFVPETDWTDDEILRQALAFAQSLLLTPKLPGKVN